MSAQTAKSTLSPKYAFEQDHFSTRWIVLFAITLAAVILIFSPILALSWKQVPFPGFVTEQTLVVANINGSDWTGRIEGINYPERIVNFAEFTIRSHSDLERAKWEYPPGHHVRIRTVLPDGTFRDHRGIQMMEFPNIDFLRFFWLPYIIGLIYFAIGFGVYLLRSQSPVGRVFTFFCMMASISSALLFDIMTTHVGSTIWTMAIALQGGALISLGFLFPLPLRPLVKGPWLRFLPYIVSVGLMIWGLIVVNDMENPWRYILAWRYSYIYNSIGILFFLVMMIARQRALPTPVLRQQTRIVLLGGLLAFLPIALWLGAPIFGFFVRWNPDIILPFLVIFPLSIGIAIVRYRLWDIESLINKAMVYGAVTVILGIVFIISVFSLQRLFSTVTGSESDLAAIISTILIATLFNPLRIRLQENIDRRFYRHKYDAEKTLMAFSSAVRDEVDLDNLSERLLAVIDETLEPSGAAMILIDREGASHPTAVKHP